MIPIVTFLLALLSTATYCLLAWYLSAAWVSVVPNMEQVSLFAYATIRPIATNTGPAIENETIQSVVMTDWAMAHWQCLAVLSLFVNAIWGYRLLRRNVTGAIGLGLPLGCHMSVLFIALTAHIAGFLMSIVGVAYKLL